MHKKHLFVFIFLSLFFSYRVMANSTQNADQLKKMLLSSEQTYDNILALVEQTKDLSATEKMTNALKNTIKIYTQFLDQVDILTEDIEDPLKLYTEKIKLGEALMLLLEKKFIESEEKIKKAPTVSDYRYFWFERVMYVFLLSKVQLFNFFSTLEAQNLYQKAQSVLNKSKNNFNAYMKDISNFILHNKGLYIANSIFSKEVYFIEDQSTGYASEESKTFGDLELLLEFLKGRFLDYQGIFVRFASFKQEKVDDARDQGIVLYMDYQPVEAGAKLTDLTTFELTVTGDNLEDILTFTLNQASQLMSMKALSDKKNFSLSTQDINYQSFLDESLVLSKVVILKADLMYKKEIKRDEKDKNKNKLLEVGLRLTVGNYPSKK